MNIITTCPKCWEDTGAYKYLKNLEFVYKTKHIPWEELRAVDVDLLITCGIGEIDLLKLKKQKNKIGVLFCSPLAQAHVVPTSSNGDLDSLLRYVNMLKSGDIDYIFLASEQLSKIFDNEKIIYLPAPLHLEGFQISKDRKGIGYFGTMDKHKNLANMFGAVKYSGIEDSFIITGTEKVSMCKFFSNLFDMKNIIVYPRLSKQQLLDAMSKVKLSLQIGFSESFNYTTWECSMLQIPSIVSLCIFWYVNDPILKKFCGIENLDNFILIGEKIRKIYFDPVLYKDLCILSQNAAVSIMKENNQRILEILEKLC